MAAVWGTLYQLYSTAGKMAKDVELRMKQEAEEPFLYPRLQILKAKEEAKPIYKMAQGDGAARPNFSTPKIFRSKIFRPKGARPKIC